MRALGADHEVVRVLAVVAQLDGHGPGADQGARQRERELARGHRHEAWRRGRTRRRALRLLRPGRRARSGIGRRARTHTEQSLERPAGGQPAREPHDPCAPRPLAAVVTPGLLARLGRTRPGARGARPAPPRGHRGQRQGGERSRHGHHLHGHQAATSAGRVNDEAFGMIGPASTPSHCSSSAQ